MDGASFDTSSHHTIDYLIENNSAKTYTFGQDAKYIHLKHQRPIKRSLSHGNFNWNLLVDRLNERFVKEAEDDEKRISGDAMARLREFLGEELL